MTCCFIYLFTLMHVTTINSNLYPSCVYSVTKSCPTLCDPKHLICQVPLYMGFPRQEYWCGLPFLLQGIFLTQGSKQGLLDLLYW